MSTQDYIELIKKILNTGEKKSNRTGIDTVSIFGAQMRFNLNDGFPLITEKKVNFHAILCELLWFLKGETNIKFLEDNNVKIWNDWACPSSGNLGPIYGKQWRKWEKPDGKSIDQIKLLENSLREDPFSRRHILLAWNPSDIEKMNLPPCHMMLQFYVSSDFKLSAQLYQRSADMFLGVPFNIASYSLLIHMFAKILGYDVGELIHTIGDAHVYVNHFDAVKTMINNKPYKLPILLIEGNQKTIDDFTYDDFKLLGYTSHKFIPAPIAV